MTNKAPFLRLEIPVSANAGNTRRILGSVVPAVFKTAPFDHSRPNWEDPDLKQTVSSVSKRLERTQPENRSPASTPVPSGSAIARIDGQSRRKTDLSITGAQDLANTMDRLWSPHTVVSFDDVSLGRGSEIKGTLKTKLGELLRIQGSISKVEDLDITAGTAKIYTLPNPGANVHDLLWACATWREQFVKMYDLDPTQKKIYLLVTGVYTCQDTEVTWKRSKESSGGAGAKVPLHPDPATAETLPLGFELDASQKSNERIKAKCKDELILGIRYHVLGYELEQKVPSRLNPARWFSRRSANRHEKITISKVWLGEEIRGVGLSAYGGKEDEAATEYIFYDQKPKYLDADDLDGDEEGGEGSATIQNGKAH